jgi:hypothetical protein
VKGSSFVTAIGGTTGAPNVVDTAREVPLGDLLSIPLHAAQLAIDKANPGGT